MFRGSVKLLRYRTAWRELLHVLPVRARQDQWLKRDVVEINEAILRLPYYTLKTYARPSYVNRRDLLGSDVLGTTDDDDGGSPQGGNYVLQEQLRRPRQATSPERMQELRDELQFPSAVGPLPAVDGPNNRATYEEEYGSRLRPRYPESWDTVPPHQPSRVVP
ncbi:unnamed protein product [Phytomonas sp. Hart1]|nr:unnamed protein product [Phytomonas sp. Hart1]|eukprot:CCW69093.1 unnamed protein product [Phytomonas sp. isolate Hart1]